MNEQYPLTVFFDASCGLCHNEMQNIKIHDSEQHVILVDCSAEGFDDVSYQVDGVTRAAMMECLHVRDSQGAWIKGIAAFEVLYRTVGMPAMANFWGSRFTRPLMERVYPWIARNRQFITKTGLPIFFEIWSKHSARQAYKRSRQCSEGRCSI